MLMMSKFLSNKKSWIFLFYILLSTNSYSQCSFNLIQDNECNGDGSFELIIDNTLTPPFELNVEFPNGSFDNDLINTNNFIYSNLLGGNYQVIVSDLNGNELCNQSYQLEDNIITTNIFVNTFSTNGYSIDCFGNCNAEVFFNLINTDPAVDYTIDWFENEPTGIPFQSNTGTNANANGLCAGEYSMLITASTGCQIVRDYTLYEPDTLELTATTSDVVCHGSSTGSIDVNVSGGVGFSLLPNGTFGTFLPYTYEWSNSNGFSSNSQNLVDVVAGQYDLVVTDNNGCSTNTSYIIQNINQPLSLEIDSYTDTICQNNFGTIQAQATGGQGPYEFNINNNIWQNNNGLFENLNATNYNVGVLDNNNCSSFTSVNIIEANNTSSNLQIESCGAFSWNDTTYTESGTYTYSTINAAGCDSIVILELTILDQTFSTTEINSCSAILWNGSLYSSSGTYTFETVNDAGCDSIATLELLINGGNSSYTEVNTCQSYEWNGTIYTESGTYTFDTTNVSGCDSTATLNLNVSETLTALYEVSSCVSYDWEGQTYTSSGLYNFLNITSEGCDSLTTLDLTILEPTILTTIIDTACTSYDWYGESYTESGSYIFETINAQGCEYTATLDLTILEPTSSAVIASACESYNWNGITYTESGTYTYTSTNTAGCDSIEVLELTIFGTSTSLTEVAKCLSFEWNNEIYTESGDYSYITQTAQGCDSIAFLNLLILNNDTVIDYQTHCNSFTWIDGNTYTQSIDDVYYSFIDSNGCVSVVSLSLTINNSTISNIYGDENWCIEDTSNLIVIEHTGTPPFSYQLLKDSILLQSIESNNFIDSIYIEESSLYTIDQFSDRYCEGSTVGQVAFSNKPSPYVNFTFYPREVNVSDATISFSNLSSNINSFLWNFGNGALDSMNYKPIQTYLDTGNFTITLIVENEYGCTNTLKDSLIIYDSFKLYIPSAFSPDDDNVNDIFMAYGVGVQTFEMLIFNRWGELIFESKDQTEGWDGKVNNQYAPTDYYFYKIITTDPDGKSYPFIGEILLKK